MAGFGGSVKLTGADEYKKSIDQITLSLRAVSSEMKSTAASFKAGDLSQEELNEQTKSLTQQINAEKDALAGLKGQLSAMQTEYNALVANHSKLVTQYDAEKQKLEQIGKTVGTTSTEYKEQEKVVSDLATQVQASQKEIDDTGKAMDRMRIATANATTTIAAAEEVLDDLGKKTEESGEDAEEASKGYTVFKNVLANLATQAINGVVSGLQKLGQAFVSVGRSAIEGFGEFEQLEGGVKKIFGDDLADEVIGNAQKAFSTAGMSANKYLDTVTSFSASLLGSLGNDTSRAASIADTAIRDMADNANTFGTSIESIQSAYQGFAKGNYSMLDNLKLGYGGTKTEMLRLVKDAGVVKDSVKSLDDVSFAQMIEAIHIVQTNMSITGTTANEAAVTFQGSMSAMKSAWSNMLTGIGTENADFAQLTADFISTLVDEDGGGVIGVLTERIPKVVSGIGTALQTAIPQLAASIVPLIQATIPELSKAVTAVLQAIVALLPMLIPIVADLIPQICETLISLLPEIVDVGIDLILALADGIADMLPELLHLMVQVVLKIAKALLDRLPDILNTGLKLMGGLAAGIIGAIKDVLVAIGKVGKAIWDALSERVSDMLTAGKNLVEGIWKGLSNGLSWIKNKIRGWVGDVTNFIKNLFGIHSPSTLFRDEIGENLALGIGEGFTAEMKNVSNEMADAIPTDFDVNANVSGSPVTAVDIVGYFKQALSEMKIELDDERLGRFVDDTVSRMIYAY